MAIEEASVLLQTPDGPMGAHLTLPARQGPGPAVVVIQEAFGVNGNTRDVCRRLAAEGYAALAPELFHRTAVPGQVFPYDFALVQPHFSRLSNDGIAADLAAAHAFLAGHARAGGRIGLVGFCVGGFAAFLGASRAPVQAAVSFYGGGIVRPRPGLQMQPVLGEAVACPTLCLFGGKDPSIPASDVEAIRTRLAAAGPLHELVVYPDAGHAFFNDERPANHHPAAAQDAWARTLAFLRAHLSP